MKVSEFENDLNNMLIDAHQIFKSEFGDNYSTVINLYKKEVLSIKKVCDIFKKPFGSVEELCYEIGMSCIRNGLPDEHTILKIAAYSLAYNELKSENLI
jgi:hypothetical protein